MDTRKTDKKVAIILIVALILAMSGILPALIEVLTFYAIIVTAAVYLTGRLFIWGREDE